MTQQTRATTLFPWSCFHLLSLTRKLCSTQGDSYIILVLKSSLKAVRKSQHFQDLRAKTEDHKRTMHAISIQKGLCDMGNIGFSNRHLQYNKPTTTNIFIFMKCCLYMISNHHWMYSRTQFKWSYFISTIITCTGMPPNDIHNSTLNNVDIQTFFS